MTEVLVCTHDLTLFWHSPCDFQGRVLFYCGISNPFWAAYDGLWWCRTDNLYFVLVNDSRPHLVEFDASFSLALYNVCVVVFARGGGGAVMGVCNWTRAEDRGTLILHIPELIAFMLCGYVSVEIRIAVTNSGRHAILGGRQYSVWRHCSWWLYQVQLQKRTFY